jgi:hypothetical protein
MKKKFKVGCHQTEHFSIYIEAESEEEALSKAHEIVDNEGRPEDADLFDREFDTACAEEVGG